MKLCYFGDYQPDYIRDNVIMTGLRKNGAVVIECNSRGVGASKYLALLKKFFRQRQDFDLLIVGSGDFSRLMVVWARILLLFGKKPLIWDAHYSLYDTRVNDRQLVGRFSLKAAGYWLLDWLACQLSDAVLLDTDQHIEYFSQTFKVKKQKFVRVLVGANEELFYPGSGHEKTVTGPDKFIIEFHGKFIPLQGIEYIIGAAKILAAEREIVFKLIGTGQTYNKIRSLVTEQSLENVEFINKVPYDEIKEYLAEADVCLGIFGASSKALRVIPNKLYEALAMAKPVITARTPGTQELLRDQENVLFCRPADAADLAEKIIFLKNNEVLRKKIASGGYQLFQSRLTTTAIGGQLLSDLTSKLFYE